MSHAFIGSGIFGRSSVATPVVGGGALAPSAVYLLGDVNTTGTYQIRGTVTGLTLPGRYRARLFDRASARLLSETWSDSAGAYLFDRLTYRYQGYFVIAFDGADLPLNASIRDAVTPTLDGVPAWDLPLLEGETVSGAAINGAGVAADLVAIRDWSSKRGLANIVPASDGAWSVTLPNGQYDVTYFKDGCAPICHGPYLIDAG